MTKRPFLNTPAPWIIAPAALLCACGAEPEGSEGSSRMSGESGATAPVPNPLTDPALGPPAGISGGCQVPVEASLESIEAPDNVVGDGTPESCTSSATVEAIAAGGSVTFNCGPEPVTIVLEETAKIYNDASDHVVIDGGGLVTLSGGGKRRILYMNTCDESLHWTTSHCQNQEFPQVSIQNLTLVDGDSSAETDNEGGGAIWARGGRIKLVNTRFFNNRCAGEGPDVGGGAVRVFSQYEGLPVYVVNSTFGGAPELANIGSNGGGISSIDVSWSIFNSLLSHNQAIGNGGNPAESGTPGGGSGGGIYNDGNTITLSLCGTTVEHNDVNAYGSGIFFVSNNHDGTLRIEASTIRDNSGGGWNVLPGISMHDDTRQEVTNSVIE